MRLNELCHGESESPANLLGLIYDEETKRRLRKEDEEEDFLDDSKETPFPTRTPACKNLCLRSTYYFFPRSYSYHLPMIPPHRPPFSLCMNRRHVHKATQRRGQKLDRKERLRPRAAGCVGNPPL